MKLKDRPTPGLIDSAQFKSRHNVNDPVVIYFGNSGIIKNCKVIKIHFTESTVSYDVEVKWTHEDQEYENTDRLYNLHSSIVFNPNDFEPGAFQLDAIKYALEIKDLWSADQFGGKIDEINLEGTLNALKEMENRFVNYLKHINHG